MYNLPRIFSHKKQSKRIDQSRGNPSPSSRPKLVRKNAAKNFEYYPSPSLPSSSLASSTTSTSSAPRTRSLYLCGSSERSLRVRDGQLDHVWGSLGLSGPEDFEIPRVTWDRKSFDIIQQPKSSPGDEDEIGTAKVDDEVEHKAVPVVRAIKRDRPPILTPPQMTLLHGDDEYSTPDMAKGSILECDGRVDMYPRRPTFAEDRHDGPVGVKTGKNVARSDTSSFTSSHDDVSPSSYRDNSPTVKSKINIPSWQKGNRLGQGSFGAVYRGISSDGMFFAIKEVSLLEQGSQGRESILALQKEIEMLSQLQHENIVQYLGTAMDDANLYIFLELVDMGSLALLYQIYVLPDSVVSVYTRQILSGLKYLHSRNIVHRDIKCANILVASSGKVKVADFGLAKAVKLNDLKSCKGTALWMAPEVVNQSNQGYGTAADIWSLGCTVLEMATGQLPYHPLDSMQALYRIGQGEPPPVPDSLSTDLRDFILKCLQVDPNARPSAAELLDHPFLKRPLGSESPAFGRWPGR